MAFSDDYPPILTDDRWHLQALDDTTVICYHLQQHIIPRLTYEPPRYFENAWHVLSDGRFPLITVACVYPDPTTPFTPWRLTRADFPDPEDWATWARTHRITLADTTIAPPPVPPLVREAFDRVARYAASQGVVVPPVIASAPVSRPSRSRKTRALTTS